MNIVVIGTGYVGLVTGVCLSEVGHHVTCIDVDLEKIAKMKEGFSPIYEPGLEELMSKNIQKGRLNFTTMQKEELAKADVIYIAVGTPPKEDGTLDLRYINQVAKSIGMYLEKDGIIVTKSTVPVGTNEYIKELIEEHLVEDVCIHIVSNPEFLREGSAIYDTFNGDRIVIGSASEEAASVIEEINKPFGIPIFKTDIRSAEMIKYASNAFLATKISFINEISNICEKVDANVEDVAMGMGQDTRIGSQFLKAGIGYGGSCFPKDTQAMLKLAQNVNHQFDLLESVITINSRQQLSLVEKAKNLLEGGLKGKKIVLLGLAFKPNTDDMREAASVVIAQELVKLGADIIAFDPVAMENARKVLPTGIHYALNIEEALTGADAAFIITEWDVFKDLPLNTYVELMKTPVIFDGRNCYALNYVRHYQIEYHSFGRPSVLPIKEKVNSLSV